jgi:hypothetical protein
MVRFDQKWFDLEKNNATLTNNKKKRANDLSLATIHHFQLFIPEKLYEWLLLMPHLSTNKTNKTSLSWPDTVLCPSMILAGWSPL